MQTTETEWATLRAALPVPVIVGHRQHSRPYGDYQHGGDHIVVQEPVAVGRFKREAFTALCETKSTYMWSYLERRPEDVVGGVERQYPPNCQTCLKHAQRIATTHDERGGAR